MAHCVTFSISLPQRLWEGQVAIVTKWKLRHQREHRDILKVRQPVVAGLRRQLHPYLGRHEQTTRGTDDLKSGLGETCPHVQQVEGCILGFEHEAGVVWIPVPFSGFTRGQQGIDMTRNFRIGKNSLCDDPLVCSIQQAGNTHRGCTYPKRPCKTFKTKEILNRIHLNQFYFKKFMHSTFKKWKEMQK